MMHECPKCGFVQPKDRYCANCGLDIDAYQPAPKPVWQRLLHNTAFQIGLAVGLILAMVIYIGLRDRDALQDALNVTSLPTPPSTTMDEEAASSFVQKKSDQGSETEAKEPQPPSQMKIETNEAAVSDLLPTQLQISFVELRKTLVQELSTEGQILSDSDVVRTVAVPKLNGATELRTRDPDTELLPGGDTQTIRVGTPMVFDFTHISPIDSQDLGLVVQVVPTSASSRLVEVEITATLNIIDANDRPLNTQQMNGSFSFVPDSTLFIFGLLPRQGMRVEDYDIFAQTPLAIYSRPEFANNVTEFAIMVLAK